MDINYNGWSIYDKVILVVRKEKKRYGYEQAYVVDASNKKSLEAAKKWANTYMPKAHIPEEVSFNNSDFEVELYGSAGHSDNGGKLSFWNCIIRKDGREFLVGINSELLLQLLLQSECKNGKFKEKVCFARRDSNTGVLHKGMKEYEQALKDKKIKEDLAKSKTSKHEVGNSYHTLYKDNIYLGEMFQWFKCEKGQEWGRYNYEDTYKFTMLDKPIKRYSFPATYDLKNMGMKSIKSVGELLGKFESYLESGLKEGKELDAYDIVRSVKILDEDDIVAKLPSRTLGDIHLESTGQEKIETLINKVRQEVLELGEQKYDLSNRYFLGCFGYSWRKQDKPVYTEEQKDKIMSLFNEYIRVDFGDGEERKGTYVRKNK